MRTARICALCWKLYAIRNSTEQGVSEEIIGSDTIDLKAYGEEILIRSGYLPTSDQTGYIFSPSHDGISQDISPQAPEMKM